MMMPAYNLQVKMHTLVCVLPSYSVFSGEANTEMVFLAKVWTSQCSPTNINQCGAVTAATGYTTQ